MSWLDGVEVSSECGKAQSEPTLKLSCHSSAKELDDNSRVEYRRGAEFRSSYSSVKGVEYCMTGPWDESVSLKSLKGFDSDMTVPRKSVLDFEGGKSDVSSDSCSKAKASRVNLKLASLSFEMSEERCKDEERLTELEAKLEAEKIALRSREAQRRLRFAEAEKCAWEEESVRSVSNSLRKRCVVAKESTFASPHLESRHREVVPKVDLKPALLPSKPAVVLSPSTEVASKYQSANLPDPPSRPVVDVSSSRVHHPPGLSHRPVEAVNRSQAPYPLGSGFNPRPVEGDGTSQAPYPLGPRSYPCPGSHSRPVLKLSTGLRLPTPLILGFFIILL